MDQRPDHEMQDIIEEVPEDLGHNWKKGKNVRRRIPAGFNPELRSLVFWGAGVLILIILIALIFGGNSEDLSKEIHSIKARLDQIEKRLITPEDTGHKITGLEDKVKLLEPSIARLEKSEKSLKNDLNKLGQQVRRLQTGAPSHPKPRYHTVRHGETLFGIAQKYGISVSKLRGLNKLTKAQRIQPGQKLLVAQGANQ
jgi:LysM repeat protein